MEDLLARKEGKRGGGGEGREPEREKSRNKQILRMESYDEMLLLSTPSREKRIDSKIVVYRHPLILCRYTLSSLGPYCLNHQQIY